MTYSLTITTAKRSTAVRITGDLDYQTSDDLVEVATQLLARIASGDLHLDFTETKFVDSAALSGLLLLQRRAEQSDVKLHLDQRPHFLDRILQVTGLFDHFVSEADGARLSDPDLVSQGTSGEFGIR